MTAYYNEYDPKAAAWIRELIRRGLVADGVVDERSILDVQPDDLRGFTQCHFFAGILGWPLALRMAGWPDDRPVWTGSPPCQPFSAAGRQKGKDDERHLAPHFAALVAECRPSVLFGEQVASAAVFGKAASGARKAVDGAAPPEWAWLDDLFERLEAAHYACGASDIPAAGVGAAHIRQRTFFGACRLADAAREQHDRPRLGGAGRRAEHPDCGADGGLADADDTGSQGRLGVPERAGERLAGAHGMGGGLADALHAGRPEWRPLAGGGSVAGGSGGLCGLANADGGQRGRFADGEGRLGHGAAPGRQQGNGEPERGGERGGLGDPSGPTGQRYAGGVSGAEAEEHGARKLVNGRVLIGPEHASPSVGERPDAPDSPWRVADWLFCRDGKWRPVKSSVLGLADGVPGELVRSGAFVPASYPLAPAAKDSRRVMRLRGYGNAIVPAAAAEFIKAFDAASAECFRLTDLSRITTDNEGVFG